MKRIVTKDVLKKNPGGFPSAGWRLRTGRFVLAILLAFIIAPFALHASELSCSRLPDLMEAFHAHHYAMKSTTGEIMTQAADQMIKQLDPSRTLLYASDLPKIRSRVLDVFEGVSKGNCVPLNAVYALMLERTRENEAMVKSLLGPGFKPDRHVSLMIQADKRPYPKTATEKRELLRKIVLFQIENALVAGMTLDEAKKQQIHRYELQTLRAAEQNQPKLINTFAEAFARALDPHTSYLSARELEDLRISMQLSLEGIGAVLTSDNGFTIIEELIPGGGAEKAGLLKPKDKIIAVTQHGEKPVDVIDMDLRDVIGMIRGKKGTRVTLTILRQEPAQERFNVTILRDKIDITEQEAKITYEERTARSKTYRIGVIDLPSFYGGETGGKSCHEDVKKLLAQARQKNVDGIVLNLSRNSGGLLDEAARLTGLFIGKGGVVAVKDGRGREMILANGSANMISFRRKIVRLPEEPQDALYKGPLVVLTSRLSASASEIVAGALQDYRRAVVVGSDSTYGKGSVQTLMELPGELGAMKVTTGLYFLPGGHSTQHIGVSADVTLPGWFALEDVGEATLDYSLPSQTIAPFMAKPEKGAPFWKAVDAPLIATLRARSQARVSKDEKFAEILKNNKEAAQRQGLVLLEDLRKNAKKENGPSEKESRTDQKRKVQEQYAPYIHESINVLLDMIALDGNQADC